MPWASNKYFFWLKKIAIMSNKCSCFLLGDLVGSWWDDRAEMTSCSLRPKLNVRTRANMQVAQLLEHLFSRSKPAVGTNHKNKTWQLEKKNFCVRVIVIVVDIQPLKKSSISRQSVWYVYSNREHERLFGGVSGGHASFVVVKGLNIFYIDWLSKEIIGKYL